LPDTHQNDASFKAYSDKALCKKDAVRDKSIVSINQLDPGEMQGIETKLSARG